MAVQNYVTPTGKLVVTGEPPRIREKNLGTVANGYPGRLVVREDTDYDIKVSDGKTAPIGFLGFPGEFEGTDLQYTAGSISSILTVDSAVPVYSGGGFTIYMPSGLTSGSYATEGDILLSWANGQVIPGVIMGGRVAIKVPFSQNASSKDTGIDIPGGVLITDCIVDVVANVGGSSIDVGFINAVESGDEDGLLDGESCVAAGLQAHTIVDATEGNITVGAYLCTHIAEANGSSAVTLASLKAYKTDGTIKSLCYKTSAHAVSGYIYVFISSPGVIPVGRSGTTVDATTATAGVFVESIL